MDYSEGIPPSPHLVVVLAMLSSADHIERLVEALEVRFLANRDENLIFGLLSDSGCGRRNPADRRRTDRLRATEDRRTQQAHTIIPGAIRSTFFTEGGDGTPVKASGWGMSGSEESSWT